MFTVARATAHAVMDHHHHQHHHDHHGRRRASAMTTTSARCDWIASRCTRTAVIVGVRAWRRARARRDVERARRRR